MNRWAVIASLAFVAGGLGCASSPGNRGKASISMQGSLRQIKAQEGVEIAVQVMTPEEVVPLGAEVRPYRRIDFAPILAEDYVNYADEGMAGLLTCYNLYQGYSHGLEADIFGHSPWLGGWRVNPYLSDGGNSPFLLLMVMVRNLRQEKVAVAPSGAVILDSQSHQHRALGREDLLAVSQISSSASAVGLDCRPLPSRGWVRQFYLNREVLRRTMLPDQRIFPGVTCSGIVAFEDYGAFWDGFHFLLPDVVLFQDGEPVRLLDFRFVFSGENLP